VVLAVLGRRAKAHRGCEVICKDDSEGETWLDTVVAFVLYGVTVAIILGAFGCGIEGAQGRVHIPIGDGRCDVFVADTPGLDVPNASRGPNPRDGYSYEGADCAIVRW
jgi:hypothetical protein